MRKTDQAENEIMVRRVVGELALLALLTEIINPTCPMLKLEAERVLFSLPPSREKKQLCDLLGRDLQTLDSNVCEFLNAAGVKYNENNFVH